MNSEPVEALALLTDLPLEESHSCSSKAFDRYSEKYATVDRSFRFVSLCLGNGMQKYVSFIVAQIEVSLCAAALGTPNATQQLRGIGTWIRLCMSS